MEITVYSETVVGYQILPEYLNKNYTQKEQSGLKQYPDT
jgi:hypothetical protein